ncbi:hypothetical protein [Neisseria perflava]|uniref:hypothetical protein n=1 Tax=Neisseria perflava TaxID=33053 RepID=UPI00209EAA37|nr:hypothetical protein [Neisseria perflava]MCP1659704.1 hypothetical protein [Neisseria perflava]MCP1771276.1 hypothetical protein [Neisseria perflava]
MNKIWAAACAALCLGACSADSTQPVGTGLGGSLVKKAVESQCRSELAERKEWKVLSLALGDEKKAEWENKICGCAAEEAPNQMTSGEMMQMLAPSTRTQAVASVTAKTVTACFQRLYKKS